MTADAAPVAGDSPATVAAVGERTRWRPPRWAGFASLLVVLVVALVIGSGLLSGQPPTAAARAAALDTQIRCPSCQDLSVAQSSAAAAVAVRNQVAKMTAEGRTDQQIKDSLVSRYGPTILLEPPTSGLASLVWIIPIVAGAVGVAVLAALFVRRSREMSRLRDQGP